MSNDPLDGMKITYTKKHRGTTPPRPTHAWAAVLTHPEDATPTIVLRQTWQGAVETMHAMLENEITVPDWPLTEADDTLPTRRDRTGAELVRARFAKLVSQPGDVHIYIDDVTCLELRKLDIVP